MEGVYDLHPQSDGICCPNRGKLEGNFFIKLSLQLTPASSRNAKLILAPPRQLVSDLVGGITPLLALASNSCGILGMRPRCNRPTTSRPESTANLIAVIVRKPVQNNLHGIRYFQPASVDRLNTWLVPRRTRTSLSTTVRPLQAALPTTNAHRLEVCNSVAQQSPASAGDQYCFLKNRFSKWVLQFRWRKTSWPLEIY